MDPVHLAQDRGRADRSKPITWLPHAPTLANYVQAFTDQPLLLFLLNSVMVALLSTALTLFIAVLAAYALARLNLRYRELILSLIIAVSTFPLVTLLVPLFEIMRALEPAQHLDRAGAALHGAEPAGLHADPGLASSRASRAISRTPR